MNYLYLANEHLDAALKEKFPPSNLINCENGDESRQRIDGACDHRRHERGVASEADGPEQHRSVECDDVHAGELLKCGNSHGEGELRPVLPRQQSPPLVLHQLRGLAGRDKVVELLVDVGDSSDSEELLLGLIVLALLDQRVRSLSEGQRACNYEKSRDGGAAEAQPPTPATVDLGEEVVKDIGDEDSDGDCELEKHVERSPVLVGSHF